MNRKPYERKRRAQFQSIKRIVPGVLNSHGIRGQLEARQILDEARKAMLGLWGEERAAHCEMMSFSEGVLTIKILSAPALQSLRLDQVRFMNELNRKLGAQRVLRIAFRRHGF